MNRYEFNDLYIGLKHSFHRVVTLEMIVSFSSITGDCNPLHLDKQYAISQGFPSQVVFGMLTTSFLSTLAGIYIPGEKSLIHKVNTNFHKPVLLGDSLTIEGTVAETDNRFKLIKLKILIMNQHLDKVVSGSMQIGIREKLER